MSHWVTVKKKRVETSRPQALPLHDLLTFDSLKLHERMREPQLSRSNDHALGEPGEEKHCSIRYVQYGSTVYIRMAHYVCT